MSSKLFFTCFFLALIVPFSAKAADKEIIVYSARNEHLIKPLFDAYTAKTGVVVKYTTGKAGALYERLKAEGSNSPADIFITVDAGNLWQAAQADLLQPVDSAILDKNIPENLKDPQNRWFGLSVRARTIVYNTEEVDPAMLSSYENLAEPYWQNKLVLRTSKKVYNQSLVASLIADHGMDEAEKIVAGWIANLAAAPFSNDTKTLEAVAAGIGKVAIVNTYYFGRLMKKKPNLPLAIFWPNQETSGVHMNVSGAGITKYAKNPEEAKKLIEWLSDQEAQSSFASLNMEYPANPSVEPDEATSAWGKFKGNPINVAKYGELQMEAVKVMDKVGYK